MFAQGIIVGALAGSVLAMQEQKEKRQDISELLQLASYAGITALPTNPTALLELGQAAQPLESALPNPSVLSILLTAAPSTFISAILYQPSYASSFESAFAAGSSPSWFNALPTDVKSYLHTYSGFGDLASDAGALNTGISQVNVNATSNSASPATTGSGVSSGTQGSVTESTMSMTSMAAMTNGGSAAPAPTGGSSTTARAASGSVASASSQGAAPRQTGIIAVGLAGVVGILGLAVAL